MPENIEKIETSEFFPEKGKERQENVFNSEIAEKNNERAREELLEEIHNKGIKVEEETKPQSLSDDGGMISTIIKQFYSFGIKAIEKARKILSAYDLDRLHDEITKKNKR